jgi:F-type H+-transporting ATPase subunit gamma
MRRASTVEKEAEGISTVRDLTSVFESLASTRVAKVRSKVKLSEDFFQLLWKRYSSIRIDPSDRIINRQVDEDSKKVFVIISAEAGLSGDLDRHLIETMLRDYDEKTTDIIVLGSHGATQLRQLGVAYKRFFQVPESDHYIDVSPVIDAVLTYSRIIVYYEKYISLGYQDIASIDLISSVKTMSENVEEDIITADNTIFEPSLDDIADQMEITMMTLALSQTILESNLAQAASRFNAMAVAKKRASEIFSGFMQEYHRAKRSESDGRMREIMVSLKKKRQRSGETA